MLNKLVITSNQPTAWKANFEAVLKGFKLLNESIPLSLDLVIIDVQYIRILKISLSQASICFFVNTYILCYIPKHN